MNPSLGPSLQPALCLPQEVHETDISGECQTHYMVQETSKEGVVSVVRSKDLGSCKNHQVNAATVLASSYFTDSPVQVGARGWGVMGVRGGRWWGQRL